MIERLLIANRGEIARRIMRTCRHLGVETVAVYSDPDADAAFVADADVAVALGGETPAESYLRVDAIVDAARRTGADAIHPGYGFLSENASFARAVTEAGLIWVGPGPEAIEAMGSKLEAKARMEAAGVPLLPSADLTGLSAAETAVAAEAIGYPVLIKASAGGGGRGMRIVSDPTALDEAVAGAAREAESAFGDGTIYAERYVSPSRHVEVQIFGDASGRVVHVGERECSVQRRHQKIIEEAPSPSLDDATRSALHAAAVAAGEAIGYANAGTVEFLLTADGSEFFFLEVNTRLQVEHPVTEAVFGLDLVRLQLEVASGGPVPDQEAIGQPQGHAMEARLYAEDPTADYLPSTGPVRTFVVPGADTTDPANGVRLDSAIDSGSSGEVSRFYDPMVAKVIAHAPTRTAAARRLASALARSRIDGIATNRELLVRTLRHPEFLGDDSGAGNRGDSDFLARNDPAVLGRALLDGDDLAVAASAAALALQVVNRSTDANTAGVASGFRNVVTDPQRTVLAVGERELAVDYLFRRGRLERLAVDGEDLGQPVLHVVSATEVDLAIDGLRRRFAVSPSGSTAGVDRPDGVSTIAVSGPAGSVTLAVVPRFAEPTSGGPAGSTVATMPGTVVKVAVEPGDRVAEGDVLVVLEAMKMELTVAATVGGVVASVPVVAGDGVEAGTVLVVVEPDEPA
ncbi:MAG: biotin carboxylase N-terminal domain-containing protein [Actinomycetota bacterium]